MFWLKHKSQPQFDTCVHIIGVKYHTTELTTQYNELTNGSWCDCFEQAAYLCNMAATPTINDTIVLSLSATVCPYNWVYCLDMTSNQFGENGAGSAIFGGPWDFWGPCHIGMSNYYNVTLCEGFCDL